MRPLDRVASIKVKLSVVIVVAVAISALVSSIGLRIGIPVWARPLIAVPLALAVAYPIARGMTSPLREMARATQAMADGLPTAPVSATSRDEVGQLARSFNRMRAQLDDVDRQRRDLVANVSHELRTPISALQAHLENLVDGVEPPDPALLKLMLLQTERLSRMVDQLLDLSRLESGGSPLHLETFELRGVLDHAASEASLHSPTGRIVVECEPSIEMWGDPERIHQVVANLVENALRHSPEIEPVRVAAEAAGQRVIVRVIDSGPGIPAEEAERVFERFSRADRSRAGGSGGSGLGLAIVRWIVDLHGGEVSVDETWHPGCCVVVSIPTNRTEGHASPD